MISISQDQNNQYNINNYLLSALLMKENMPFCLDECQTIMSGLTPSLNFKKDQITENEYLKSSHESTSQGSDCNQSFCRIVPKSNLNSQCMELNFENSQNAEFESTDESLLSSKSFIKLKTLKTPSMTQSTTSEKKMSIKGTEEKKCKKGGKKAKIPQKLVENRRQEILASLEKVSEDSETVIEAVPRAYTGSKRGSNFRGVSVNGKKWQVMVMGFGKKRYYGGIKDEKEAAKLYDKYAILTQGVGAKTNFSYKKQEVFSILEENLKFE
mmetsp:Transcript_1059/g.931  ORF Transcript_1059/g.931 Transcript_1059/m.931 type:complete len:269 (+) Transcript_1059:19-825(+)